MQLIAIILVVSSAVCHAVWNFFIKRSRRPAVAYWWMLATALVIYLPIFIYTASDVILSRLLIVLIISSGLGKAAYYLTLGATYQHCDLSLGYPISRAGVLLIPVWAYLFLDERIAISAGVGIVLILLGIYSINHNSGQQAGWLPSRDQLHKGIYFALITGLLMSVYSVIDKAAVNAPGLRPFNFLYVMFVVSFVFLTPYIWITAGSAAMKAEVRGRLGILALMGLLDLTGYLAVLFAMQLAPVSYVVALRQVSIVIGTGMGTMFLKEKYGGRRALASLIIFAGSWLISISK